jgi:ribulose-5-phosphate 4-epimerase/fuculose-1-phosphate aldolase
MMTSVTQLKTKTSEEKQLRIDLAAAFRLAEHFNWHEGVANHFSLAVSSDGKQFLMNPKWKHFSGIRASDLLLLDADDKEAMKRPDAPDETAWCIHGRMHALVPSARCVLHLHPKYATALVGLADPEIKPIDQNTARFYKRVAYDLGYEGMANSDAEGNRLAALLGNHKTMMMGNHGVLIAAASVAEAFDELYYLERACQTLMLAYASGQKLNIMSDKVADQTAHDWDLYTDSAFAHFDEMKKVLDRKDPSYAE